MACPASRTAGMSVGVYRTGDSSEQYCSRNLLVGAFSSLEGRLITLTRRSLQRSQARSETGPVRSEVS